MSDLAGTFEFRPPSISQPSRNTEFKAPPADSILGKWHVVQSTLPMWKSKKNVCITYTSLPDAPDQLDDLVEYQGLTGGKLKSVCGIDTPDPDCPAAYNWRGKGWLKIASSRWEVIGYGEQEGGWAVTYFAKTLFTPAGIDVYSRRKEGLSGGLLQKLRETMGQIPDTNFTGILNGIFPVVHE